MSSFKKVIDTLDKAADGFGSIANQEQKKIYDEVIALAKDLDTDALGRVKQSIANLKRLTQIKAKLAALSKDKEWVAGISQFVKYFDVLQRQQNAYFSQQFGKKTLSESAQKKNELMKQLSVQNTIEALMGDGLKANVTDKLNDILLRAVTTGAKYADLTEELRTHLMGKEGGQGAFARYATTYATTALSQYTGQQNKLLSEGLDTEWYVYEGSNKETTREFCEQLTRKRFIHKSEIPTILKGKIDDYQCEIYDKTGLPLGMIEGTTPENFQCNCGGWNCRHQLIPVAEAVVPKIIRDRIAFAQKIKTKLKEFDGKDDTINLPTTAGKLMVATPLAAIVAGTYEQIRTAIQMIYKVKTDKEKNEILNAITKANEYKKITKVSSKNGSVFGYSSEQYKYNTEEETPKNVHLASKIANDGDDVWLVPNIGGSISADYIVKHKSKFLYVEGKIITGKRGVQNAINNGNHQSNIIAIDVQIYQRAADISEIVRNAFIEHKKLKELWLYKGSMRIIVKRQWAESKNFMKQFEKIWTKTK